MASSSSLFAAPQSDEYLICLFSSSSQETKICIGKRKQIEHLISVLPNFVGLDWI
jgi:hypothetical protein